jgi:asparagine synthase (glutamine-hydrolysing)
MCGICGFTASAIPREEVGAVLAKMATALHHRGPDDEGSYVDDDVALAHKRLSIIDLAGGRQPIHNEDKSVWIVFNGEIYGFRQLREALAARGHAFYTQTDTETIVHLYEEDGVDCLGRLNGMFAFALWDTKARQLFLARDRIGEKPLYYCHSPRGFIFASELKGLLEHPLVERRLDLAALSKYLTFEYVPAPTTIFEGIRKLPAGHYLVYRDGPLREGKYWEVPISESSIGYRTEAEYAEELVYLLRSSVERMLVSDVPIGILLSGGIDSSLVAALASRLSPGRVKTFTIGFRDRSFDESAHAQRVANVLGTDHHSEQLDTRTMLRLIPRITDILDEPLGDASVIPTYLLSRLASRHVKVALGGDGGDELFAGYPTYQAHRLVSFYGILPWEVRRVINRVAARLPVSHRNISFDFKIKQFLRGVGVAPEVRFFYWMGSFVEAEKRRLFADGIQDISFRFNTFDQVIGHINDSRLLGDFERILYLSVKLYLQDDILVKVDRASMANSLEVRAPYLDRDFVEFAARLPTMYKLRRLTTKYLLKQAARGLLPDPIIQRKKKGFGIPLSKWFMTDLRALLLDYLAADRIRKAGLFNPQYVAELVDDHLRRRRDYRKLLWTLLVFEMWREKYLP